jgi:hypothetical protein
MKGVLSFFKRGGQAGSEASAEPESGTSLTAGNLPGARPIANSAPRRPVRYYADDSSDDDFFPEAVNETFFLLDIFKCSVEADNKRLLQAKEILHAFAASDIPKRIRLENPEAINCDSIEGCRAQFPEYFYDIMTQEFIDVKLGVQGENKAIELAVEALINSKLYTSEAFSKFPFVFYQLAQTLEARVQNAAVQDSCSSSRASP